MFQREDFEFVDKAPANGIRCRGWDLASSKEGYAAFTVGVKMLVDQDGLVYIEDVVRGQWTPYEVERKMMACAESDGPQVYISLPQDPGQAGVAQKSAFARMLEGYNFSFSPESGAKEDRARPLAAQAESGNVYLVRAAWNDPFLAEACVFPMSKYKDQVDAASRAYAYLVRRRRHSVGGAPRVITV